METSNILRERWHTAILPYLRRRAFRVDLACLLMAGLLARVELFGALAPLGLAMVLAVELNGRTRLWYPIAGMAAGSLLVSPPQWASIAACLIYLAVRRLYRGVRGRLNRADKLLLFALSMALTLPMFYRSSLDAWMRGLATVGLALLLGGMFRQALAVLPNARRTRLLREEEQLSLCILLGAAALAFAPLRIAGFSLSVLLLSFFCLFAAYARGMQGVAAAVALAGMLVLGGEMEPVFVACLAACTLCGAFCRNMGTWGVAVGFGLCCGVISFYFDDPARHVGLFNFLPAALAFVAIPGPTMLCMRSFVNAAAREELRGKNAYTRMRRSIAGDITRTANAVERLAALLPAQEALPSDPLPEGQYMVQAAGHVCADCVNRAACWREPKEALQAISTMLPAHARGIRPRPEPPLNAGCRHTVALCAAAAQAQAQYRSCSAQAALAQAQRDAARRALEDTGGVLTDIASRLAHSGVQDEGLAHAINHELAGIGLRARCVSAGRQGAQTSIWLRLPIGERTLLARAVDAAARASGRSLRLLSQEESSREVLAELEYCAALHAQVGMAACPKAASSHNGDTMARRALPRGKELCVVSDGMGSGPLAHAQSRDAVELLLTLSAAGYPLPMALSCVNYVRPQGAGQEAYATMDVLELDLQSGETMFYKCGAPPSFVLRGGEVHAVYAEALPAGIVAEATPAVQQAKLCRNDAVVMLTDGALDALGEQAAEVIRVNVGGANTPQDAADALLEAARAISQADDMSVLVVRVA